MTDLETPTAATEQDNSKEAVLRRRAERLARVQTQQLNREVLSEVALIAVGDETFAIPSSGLKEIIPLPEITNLPSLPQWILGIAHIRGELLSVVDLARLLDISATGDNTSLAVVEGEGGILGICTQRVLGFRTIFIDEQADDFDQSAAVDGRPILATTKDLVSVLDLDRLLASERLIVGRR